MKTLKIAAVLVGLIALLVCFLPGWGQQQPETFKQFNWETDTDYDNEYLVVALLGIYKAYEKECYADSSIHREYESYYFYGYGDPVGVGPYLEYWIHTKPTCQGFIEFLRRKGKKSN